MTQSLLGPLYTVTLRFEDVNSCSRGINLLVGKVGEYWLYLDSALATEIAGSLRDCLKSVVADAELEHDGYSFAWEPWPHVRCDEDCDNEFRIAFRFTVKVKREDFTGFSLILRTEYLALCCTQALTEALEKHLSRIGFEPGSVEIRVAEVYSG